MIQPYRLKNVRIRTYDGRVIRCEFEGIYNKPRKVMEELIVQEFAKIMKGDIPVKAEFVMQPI